MRDASFVGLTADGQWLIVERDGEHLRVPVDDALRAAMTESLKAQLHGGVQMPMPLQTAVSPREVQHRIRTGESAAQIAKSSGVSVELIARFEGAVLDERRWQAERARATVVDGTSLEERFALATNDGDAADSGPTSWDAWVDSADGGWRIRAISPDGRAAVWAWDTHTTKLRARDDLARRTLSGRIVSDDLEAVLRPIAAARAERERPEPVDAVIDEPTEEPQPPRVVAKRRTSVPSWDEIVLGSTGRPSPDET
jgi:hypothetical protein